MFSVVRRISCKVDLFEIISKLATAFARPQRVEDFIFYIRTEKRSNVEHLEMPNGKMKKKK